MSDVKIKFGAEDENLNATLSSVKKNLKDVDVATGEVSKGFDVGFKTIAAGAAAGALAVKAAGAVMNLAMDGARAVIDKFGEALDFGGKMTDMSKSTGVAAGELTLLERAFENSGVGADKLGPRIGKLQKFVDEASMGGKEQIETMNRLGLKYEDLQGKAPTEQMKLLANSISNVIDPGERAALSMKVFGGKTADMIPLILDFDGELKTAKNQVGTFAEVMGRSSGRFDDLGDNLAAMKTKTLEFAAGFLEKALPALNAFVTNMSGVDAAGWGAKMMDMVLRVADVLMGAFKNPMGAIDLLGTALLAGAKSFGNAMLNGIINLGETIGVQFIGGFKIAVNEFKGLMVRGAEAYLSFMIDGLIKVASIFPDSFSDSAKALGEGLKGSVTVGATLYGMQMDKENRKIEDDLTETMANTRKSTTDFFGAQPELDKLREGTAKLEEDGKKFREQFTESKDISFDMRKDFGAMESSAERLANESRKTGFALLSAGQPLRKDTKDAKENMREIKTIGELLKERDKIPPMKKFREQVKDAREDLEKMKDIMGKDLSKMAMIDIAKEMNIPHARRTSEELFVDIKKRMEEIKSQKLEIGVNKNRTQEDIDNILTQVREMGYEVGTPLEVGLDGKEAVKTIREDLKKEIDISLSSSKGTTILEDVKKAVEIIRDCVKLIEPKLPQRALS